MGDEGIWWLGLCGCGGFYCLFVVIVELVFVGVVDWLFVCYLLGGSLDYGWCGVLFGFGGGGYLFVGCECWLVRSWFVFGFFFVAVVGLDWVGVDCIGWLVGYGECFG